MSGMHFLIGICTNDYVILAADRSCFAHGAIVVTDGYLFYIYFTTLVHNIILHWLKMKIKGIKISLVKDRN